jgi:dethiobiotin synthetase
MIDDFVVVGTDTGVGKTVVTAGLVGMLRTDGIDAKAIKPCQTGYPLDDDAGFVTEACGAEAAATCLRRLEPALAPEAAAEREGVTLSYVEILSGCEQALADAECGVIEGIGGLRVPLADGREVIDLVADLDLSALVVARSGLGTLNHTMLTVEALRQREIPILGIVLNEYDGETIAEQTNPPVMEQMTGQTVWTLPSLDLEHPGSAIEGAIEYLSPSLLEALE